MLPGKLCSAPVRNLIPGKQLGEDDLYQIDERILFESKDYDKIAALGWNAFWDEHYQKISRKTLDEFTLMQRMSNQLYVDDMNICAQQGMPIFLGVAVETTAVGVGSTGVRVGTTSVGAVGSQALLNRTITT